MIYYPNKLERYTSALRLLYQKFILKAGIKYKFLISLRKIYEAEAFFYDLEMPIDVEDFCSEIFTAVILKKKFDYYIDTKEKYLINKKLFTAVILNLSTKTDYLEIKELNKKLVIMGRFAISEKLRKLITKLGGIIFRTVKENRMIICFSFNKTEKETEDFETAYYLLQNPLSAVNLYLID